MPRGCPECESPESILRHVRAEARHIDEAERHAVQDPQPPPHGHGPDIGSLVEAELERHAAASPVPATVRKVMVDVELRIMRGKKEYGERLKAHNGRDFLIDTYQEILDGLVYARGAMVEYPNSGRLAQIYAMLTTLAVAAKQSLIERAAAKDNNPRKTP